MGRTFYEIASEHIRSSLQILEKEDTKDNAEKTLLGKKRLVNTSSYIIIFEFVSTFYSILLTQQNFFFKLLICA
jgi:hypothetical protein